MKLTYRLRELMYSKYSEQKFAVACEIVARWVAFDTKNYKQWTAEYILQLCNQNSRTRKISAITPKVANSLKKLFGLKSIDDLYN